MKIGGDTHNPKRIPSEMIGGHELVSVVIICFNQSHFLGDAIESVRAQTFPGVEIVVVDDGSTDRTTRVAHSYPQVTYIYQRNQGISSARNSGFRASSGNYIAFLDADDRLLPNAVDAGLHCFRKYPGSGFVFGRYRKVNASGAVISEPNQTADECDFYVALLQRNLIGMQSTVLYPRDVLERARGFDEQLRSCEDYDLYLRLAREFPVHKHDEVVAEYRQHNHNMSRNYRSMLEMTLSVLNMQTPHVLREIRYKKALRAGISNWRRHYGNLMVQDFRNNFNNHGLDRSAIRCLGDLARIYPQGIGQMTKKALRGMVHRSARTPS